MSTQTKEKKQNNQTENEFFALATTGRKGVEEIFEKMGGELAKLAAQNVSKHMDTWKIKFITDVMDNDSLQRYGVLSTRAGLYSIYKAMAKAASMGLQPGMRYRHYHLMPKEGKAVFVPDANGLAFCSAYGPGAVLQRPPEIVPVYEKDKFRILSAEKEIVHEFEPFGERGKIVGWYTELNYKDGTKEIPYVTQEDVQHLIKSYSQTKTSKGQPMPAFEKSEFDMWKKTAAKRLLRKPAAESEALANALADLDYEDPEPTYQGEPIDITDRVSSRLDNVIEKTPEPNEPDQEEAPEPEPEAAENEEAETEHPGDLF